MCAEPWTVQQIGDELYQLPPAAFTAARDAAVAHAKTGGDADAAAALAAMKKPSVAAWLVNLVALRSPESVHRLLALGQTIRSAQSDAVSGSAEDHDAGDIAGRGAGPGHVTARLRDLATARRSEMADLLNTLEQLAAAAGGPTPTRQHLADVEATISAAMADESAARTVLAGRVLKPMAYHGFGDSWGDGWGGAHAPAGPHAPAAPHAPGSTYPPGFPPAPPAVPDREARRARARQHHEASLRRLAEARHALARTQESEAEAAERLRALVAQRAEIQQQLAQAGDDVRAATRDRLAAERAVAAAERAETMAGRASTTLDT
jgi:hypothetical protein